MYINWNNNRLSIILLKMVKSWRICLLIGLFCISCLAVQSPFNEKSYYRVTTMWRGLENSLDIKVQDNGFMHPILAETDQNSASQHWRIMPSAYDGYFYLSTLLYGQNKTIDIINNGDLNREPHLTDKGDWSGQLYKFTPLDGGWYRLTTQWQGDGKSLDIRNDGVNTHVWLANSGLYSGQFWKFEEIDTNQYFRMTTSWRGDDFSMDIAVDPNGFMHPELAPTAFSASQIWRFIPIDDQYSWLTTFGHGADKAIDVINDGGAQRQLHLVDRSLIWGGQRWKFIKINDEYTRIVNSWKDKQSLDIRNDGVNTHVWLADTGNYSGQYWKLTPI